ncbi:hypothetical protein TNCV_4771361 [Trichonephila clavipes]|nr:hypothetical protein TNCV_4771361 [Trichonephila clavipes]
MTERALGPRGKTPTLSLQDTAESGKEILQILPEQVFEALSSIPGVGNHSAGACQTNRIQRATQPEKWIFRLIDLKSSSLPDIKPKNQFKPSRKPKKQTLKLKIVVTLLFWRGGSRRTSKQVEHHRVLGYRACDGRFVTYPRIQTSATELSIQDEKLECLRDVGGKKTPS